MRNKFSSIATLVAAVAIFCLAGGLAIGQAVYGTISGTVTDNTGGVIPGAEVVIENTAKGTSWTVITDDQGYFRKERLLPGSDYQVTVALEGFQTYIQENVTVTVDEVVDLNLQLQLGELSETVTVTGAPPPLKTEKTDVSVSFSEKEVTELPIFERNFSRFLLLTPGTGLLTAFQHASSENPQGGRQIQVNGQHFSGTGFELDGTSNRDPILGIIVINPTLEGVTQAKVTSQNYDAEFGQATAGVVTAQTKSGSNDFHGSAFLFRRNDEQQARNPFTQANPLDPAEPDKFIPDTLWNQFGGSIGGPIARDKAFFFFDYQGTRRKNGGSVLTTVPTQLARQGNFSEYGRAIFNPNTGNADGTGREEFDGGVIPNNLLSPQALNLISLLPLPTQPGTQNNFTAGGIEAFDDDAFNVRGDWAYSPNLQIFGRYSFADFERSGPGAFGELVGGPAFNNIFFAGTSQTRNQSVATGFDYTLSPTALADFRFGFFRYRVDVLPGGVGTTPAADAGIPNLNSVPGVDQDPIFTSGMPYFNITSAAGTTQFGYSLGVNQCNCPLEQSEQQWQWVNNWIFTRGDHTLKFGADIRWAQNRRVPSDAHRAGELTFNDNRTSDAGNGGLGLASFLVGDVSSFRRFVSPITDAEERQKRWFFYGQDTWNISDKLTFNYGLRWEIYFPESVTDPGEGGFFDVTDASVRVAGVGGVGLDFDVDNSYTNLAPRLGLTYQVSDRSVLRLGYGRSFDLGVFGSVFGHAVTQNLPVLAEQSLNPPNNFASVFNLANGPATPPFPQPGSDGTFAAPDGVGFRVRPQQMRLPTLDAWNVTYQRELTNSLVWEIGYVGNKGTHVFAGDGPNYDINQPIIDSNPAGPGQFSPTNSRRPFFAGPIGSLGGPFGLSQGFSYFGNDASNNYHSIQTKLEKRFSDNYSLLAHYTLARARNYDGNYFIHNADITEGANPSVQTSVLVINSLIELPFGQGQKYGSDVGGAANAIIGGWQTNFTLTAASGRPFEPSHADCGQLRDTGPCRPNVLGDIETGGDRNQYFTVCPNGDCSQSSVYEIPQPGTFGNAERNSLRGPNFVDANFSIFKNFELGETSRLQFRAEIFNVFNKVNLANPNNCINCDPNNDGRITGLVQGASMRRVQWALRLEF
ncbi:MAG TPA: TonB-dependent receptor [Acidobacteriota bacterium]|nr:TonB-dependent receptor [Acidobacteriota bacterium]